MAITLGSNIASLRGQRELAKTSSELGTVFERLSSGQRINKASDDAAGLSLADSLKSRRKLYGAANRNINDAISATSILESALTSQQSIVTRMSELAEQAANGVYSSAQRSALNGEYMSLMQEFQRIAQTTQFNGVSLISTDASQPQFNVQVGIGGDSDSTLTVAGVQSGIYSGTTVSAGDHNGSGSVNAFDTSVVVSSSSLTFDSMQQLMQGSVGTCQITDSLGQTRTLYFGFVLASAFGVPANMGDIAVWTQNSSSGSYNRVVLSSTVDFKANNTLNLSFASGATGSLTLNFSGTQFVTPLGADAREAGYYLAGSQTWLGSGSYSTKSAIGFTGVETALRARDALTTLSNRSTLISQSLGEIGAIQSRLAVASSMNGASADITANAESRIRDADIAEESSRLVRLNILQQAAASVLAQANQQPALALQLLRGGG